MPSFINSKAGKTAATGTTVTNPINKLFDALDPNNGRPSANIDNLEQDAKAAVKHISDRIEQSAICPGLKSNMEACAKALTTAPETPSTSRPKNT